MVYAFMDFRMIEIFGWLNPWISCFDPLLDSIPHPESAWNEDFVEGGERIHRLNY